MEKHGLRNYFNDEQNYVRPNIILWLKSQNKPKSPSVGKMTFRHRQNFPVLRAFRYLTTGVALLPQLILTILLIY